eukprot:COSAG04_NODE_28582_length_274_cov_1.765714_1_plen_74_part_01
MRGFILCTRTTPPPATTPAPHSAHSRESAASLLPASSTEVSANCMPTISRRGKLENSLPAQAKFARQPLGPEGR